MLSVRFFWKTKVPGCSYSILKRWSLGESWARIQGTVWIKDGKKCAVSVSTQSVPIKQHFKCILLQCYYLHYSFVCNVQLKHGVTHFYYFGKLLWAISRVIRFTSYRSAALTFFTNFCQQLLRYFYVMYMHTQNKVHVRNSALKL